MSAAHSPLNFQSLLQEVSKAVHKGSASSLHWHAYDKDLSLDLDFNIGGTKRRKLELDKGRGKPDLHEGSHKLPDQSVKSEVKYPANRSVT